MPLGFREQDRRLFTDVPVKWDVPFNTWLGVKFGQGFNDTAGTVINKQSEEFIWDDGDRLTPEELNNAFGIPGELEFTQPESYNVARLLRERKDAELARRAFHISDSASALSFKAVAGFTAGVLGSIAHPVDLAAGFLISPVGSTTKAANLAKAGAGTMKQALARRLVSQEFLQTLKYPKLTEAVIEGTFGNLVTEIPVFLQAQRDQADYTIIDSVLNIGLGGLFSGGIHLGVRAIERIRTGIKGAADVYTHLTPETKSEAFKTAVNQMARDEDINVAPIVGLDPKVIEIEARFVESEAIARANQYADLEDRNIRETATAELGRVRLEGIDAVNNADYLSVKLPEGSTFVRVTDANGKTSIQPAANIKGQNIFKGANIQKIEAGIIGKNEKGKTDFLPVQGEVRAVEAKRQGSQRVDRETFEKRVKQIRDERVRNYVEEMRRDSEIMTPEKVEARRNEAAAEIQREHAAKIPADKKAVLDRKVDVIEDAEIAEIDASSKDIATNLQKELSEEEKAIFQKELDELNEATDEALDKAVDSGIPCVISESLKNG